jgi:transaldolase
VDGPISAEVISLDSEGMVKEAMELSKIHKKYCHKDSHDCRRLEGR